MEIFCKNKFKINFHLTNINFTILLCGENKKIFKKIKQKLEIRDQRLEIRDQRLELLFNNKNKKIKLKIKILKIKK